MIPAEKETVKIPPGLVEVIKDPPSQLTAPLSPTEKEEREEKRREERRPKTPNEKAREKRRLRRSSSNGSLGLGKITEVEEEGEEAGVMEVEREVVRKVYEDVMGEIGRVEGELRIWRGEGMC